MLITFGPLAIKLYKTQTNKIGYFWSLSRLGPLCRSGDRRLRVGWSLPKHSKALPNLYCREVPKTPTCRRSRSHPRPTTPASFLLQWRWCRASAAMHRHFDAHLRTLMPPYLPSDVPHRLPIPNATAARCHASRSRYPQQSQATSPPPL